MPFSEDVEAVSADLVLSTPEHVVAPGWVGFENGRIREVVAGPPPRDLRVLRGGPGSILMPGLVNAHAHLALGAAPLLAPDRGFWDWLHEGILKTVMSQGTSDRFYRVGAARSVAQLLEGGVTTVADNFLRPEGADALRRAGLSGIFFQEVFGSLAPDEDAYAEEVEALATSVPDRVGDLPFGWSPHTPWTCPKKTLLSVVARARDGGHRISMHVDESVEEHDCFVHQRGRLHDGLRQRGVLNRYEFGLTPVAYLERLGVLGPDLLAVHCVQIEPLDIERLARTGTHVVHCPRSNMRLAEGFAPIRELLDAGVNVALGTDSTASADGLDMFDEMRTAMLVQRARWKEVGPMTARRVLEMATLSGASAMGFSDLAGALKAGFRADMVLLDPQLMTPSATMDPASVVVHVGERRMVEVVVAAGRVAFRRSGR